jgi:hypothetical protein
MENTTLRDDHHSHYHLCSMRCVSWPAIIFGALVAISLGFLCNVFSIAIGLSAFPVTPEGKEQFAAWGFAGLVMLAIITMFASGWITGFLARAYCFKRNMGELYGFGAWALALVLTIFLASGANSYLSQRAYMIDRSLTTMQFTHEVAASVNEAANTTTSPQTEDAATKLGVASFATFFLLFIGALSSSLGGRIGIRFKRGEHPDNCPTCK